MNKTDVYYKKISELEEAADFMRVIDKWERLSERISPNSNIPMVLPDLFWVAKSGVGKTHLLRLLSEYLCERGNIMDFHGNVKYFEFMLDYYPPEQTFHEIERLINEVNNAAGFRNNYRGILSVDIEEWLGHCEEKHFITFLEYLSSNSDDWLVVFNVTGEKEEEIEKLESILSMYFRLEKSTLCLPDTKDLVNFVSRELAEYELSLEPDAASVITSAIEQLRKNKYFDGYKTLKILCRDIAYEMYSAEDSFDRTVTGEDLAAFACDSQYIKRVTWKSETKKRIGFGGGNEG